ncbi:MAG: methyl-accepting chemotaxis protein [Treponema sp.]|jgi:methyl-accepting chemotaxis protein|nr:methyl-accepting chemotaxis protein [Treponema sp.]
MKIGVKLTTVIIAISLVGIGILTVITLRIAQTEITKLVSENAINIAEKGGEEVKVWLEVYMNESRALAHVMGQYDQIPVDERRFFFDLMLKGVLAENPALVGVWSAWAPNALDGLDAEYANTPGTDSSGRYVPVWGRTGAGDFFVEPLAGYDTTDYYLGPMQTGQEFVLPPYLYPLTGKEILITSLCIPIKNNGKVVGVVGVGIELEHIQAIVSDIEPFGDGVATLYSNKGIVAAHYDPSRIGKSMKDTEQDMGGSHLDKLIQDVRNGAPSAYTLYSSLLKSDMHVFTAPFTIGLSTTPWSIAVGVSEQTIMAPIVRLLRISIIIGVIMLLAISAAAFFLSRSITRPITYTMLMLKDVSEGDLTRTVDVYSKDEMGDLARYFNATLEKIKALIITIKNQSVSLFDIGSELASNMTETAAAINEITANIQSIKGRIMNQSASVTETNATMKQITVNIDKLNENVDKQTASVSKSSSATEKMIANINSVTQTLAKNIGGVKELRAASEVGRTGLQDVATDIQEIARESEGLLEINAVMENIASQTNLLSMNAAIEAAHAGEAGKGFAVVADEIRKLAESSSEQSKTISTVLRKIKDSIDKIIKSTDNVLNRFEAIDSSVKTVSEQTENIRSAMEEQSVGSQQILEVIGQLNDITQRVKGGSDEMLEGSREVITEGKNLEMATAEITNGMNEMAAGADQINIAVHRVNEISGQNKENIDVLVKEVSRFKVE